MVEGTLKKGKTSRYSQKILTDLEGNFMATIESVESPTGEWVKYEDYRELLERYNMLIYNLRTIQTATNAMLNNALKERS